MVTWVFGSDGLSVLIIIDSSDIPGEAGKFLGRILTGLGTEHGELLTFWDCSTSMCASWAHGWTLHLG